MPRRPGKSIIESVKRKGEEAVNRVGHLINTIEKDKEKYTINSYEKIIEIELNKYIAIVHFVEVNYKITKEERSEFMKFYWDIYETLKKERIKAESEGYVFTDGIWELSK